MLLPLLHAGTPVAVAYLAGAGLVTNSAVVSRGLLRAGRSLLRGAHEQAAVEAVSAVVAPAALAYAAARTLVVDISHGAGELIDGLLDDGDADVADDELDPLPEPAAPVRRNGRPARQAA